MPDKENKEIKPLLHDATTDNRSEPSPKIDVSTVTDESLTTQAVKQLVNTPSRFRATINFFNDAMDVMGNTVMRLLGVFGAAAANRSNDDTPNSHSFFYKFMYKNPDKPQDGLTPGGMAVTAVSILGSLTVGVVRRIYQLRHKLKLQSYKNLTKRVNKSVPDDISATTEKELIETMDDLLARGKLTQGKPKSAPVPDEPLSWNWVKSKVVNLFSDTWNALNDMSMVFWIAWMPAALILGVGGVSAGLPVIMSVTVGVAAIYGLYAAGSWIRNKYFPPAPTPVVDTVEDEEQKIAELKARAFMKLEHKKWNAKFAEFGFGVEVKPKDKSYVKLGLFIDKNNAQLIRLKKGGVNDPAPAPKVNDIDLNSELAQRLLGSKWQRYGRLGIDTLNSAIGGFVMTSFILWMIASGLGVIGVAAGVLLSGQATVFGGLTVAGLLGISTFREIRADQKAHEEQVKHVLGTVIEVKTRDEKGEILLSDGKPVMKEMTKLDYFNEVQDRVGKLQEQIALQAKNPNLHPDVKALLDSYNINSIDANNDYYFEKQRAKPSFKTMLKKGWNRFYTVVGGGQTGVLVVRLCVLTGCLFAGAVATSGVGLAVFVGLAVGAAVVVGALKLVKYQLDRQHEHNKNFVNVFDARLSYLKKKEKELIKLHKIVELNNGKLVDKKAEWSSVKNDSSFAPSNMNYKSQEPTPVEQPAEAHVSTVSMFSTRPLIESKKILEEVESQPLLPRPKRPGSTKVN